MARIEGKYVARPEMGTNSYLLGHTRWLDMDTGRVYSTATCDKSCGTLRLQYNGEWILDSGLKWVPTVPAALAPEHEYVVFVQGGQSPSKRHKSYADAETEAKRLCEKEKTKTVLVLRIDAEVRCEFTAKVAKK